ncbi:MAG TPA: patatin-like phospholipase family protein, partial [Gemmatirosa sp.]
MTSRVVTAEQQTMPGADGRCVPFATVLRYELTQLGRLPAPVSGNGAGGSHSAGASDDSDALRALFQHLGGLDDAHALSALCLSGGGIRSATFNLGVAQALARAGVLDHFDYVSSVSGGGYIAGWLKAWMRRDGTASVVTRLGRGPGGALPDPLAPEPSPVDGLREYSNYLTPRLGLFSSDTWAAGTIVLRNLLLNWLVIVPLLAAVVTLPQIALIIAASGRHRAIGALSAMAATLAEVAASWTVHAYRKRSLDGLGRASEGRIAFRSVLPLYVAAAFLAQAGLWWLPWTAPAWWPFAPALGAWAFALLWCVVVPIVTWSFHIPRGRAATEFAALVGSGVVGAALLVWLMLGAGPGLVLRPTVYVVCALPALLGVYLVSRMLFVAIASRADPTGSPRRRARDRGADAPLETADALDRADHDREWWARLTGWVLALALAWLVVSVVCVLGGHVLDQVSDYFAGTLATLGGVSGATAALLGRSAATASGRVATSTPTSPVRRIALATAVPLFCVLLVVLVARANTLAGRLTTGDAVLLCVPRDFARTTACDVTGTAAAAAREPEGGLATVMARAGISDPDVRRMLAFLVVPALFVAVGATAGAFVDPNRFSLHGFYRNRLVRAYLGASHVRRRPDPFTGFATNDNLRLHELWHPAGADDADAAVECTRPLPIVNATLNLVSGERLAWQQRKAESFSMTPFYCGNFREGYRASYRYGDPDGVTLGTAMTISGAAANPNMGYNSSPIVTFLMTLFNARLGAWLGNTNPFGNATYAEPGPRWAVGPIFNELLGRTTDRSAYVNLSDGGHFDNLGLYEVVLRRCRHVVVCDAGRDPACGFGDLGNAIRKIRIDFGVNITFGDQIAIRARDATSPGLYCAIGAIDYAGVDGPDAAPGWLLYLKPALAGELAPVPY